MSEHMALEGVTILDLTRVVAGPLCSSILGDMGARVIKIEIPKRGDDSRTYGPLVNGESAYFAMLNRSKEGITLNLKSEQGKKMFLEMVRKVDIVLENYRPGVMEKLGLGYGVLKKVNPSIIYGEVSGFGSFGPYSQRPGYDILAQAMGGLMSLTGSRGGDPTRAGSAMGDVLAGMNLAIGVLAALHAREITGLGQKVDVALVDSIVISLENAFTRYWYSGKLQKRDGNAYAALAPYDTFRAKNGFVVIACGNQKLYEKLCTSVLNRPELINDRRFTTNILRTEHKDELKEIIEKWTGRFTVEEVVNTVLSSGIPSGPVYDISQIVKDKHIAGARNMFPEVDQPVIGRMHMNGDAIKLLGTPARITKPAPLLGEDNKRIYKEFFNYSEVMLKELEVKGII